jgi:hypothetical protein
MVALIQRAANLTSLETSKPRRFEMYRTLILIAVLLGGCNAASNVNFNLDMGMDFGVTHDLLNIEETPTPQKDVLIVLKGMNKMPLADWLAMSLRPERYVDPMLPDMIYVTSRRSVWKLEAGPKADNEPHKRTFSRNFSLKPGQFKSFPEQRTLALQWPDETQLYTPSNCQ